MARILRTRATLRQHSVLGEYGADAIAAALGEGREHPAAVSQATIYRVRERRGALDAVHRPRQPVPPNGWYLPDLACGEAEMDSFDFIEDLKIANGPLVCVLTGISVHGALTDAWVMRARRATAAVEALCARWHAWGLPTSAQFDHDTVLQGPHQVPDTFGRVSRLCLALGVTPVFAPPREPGLQNAIEGFTALCRARSGPGITAAISPHVSAYRRPISSHTETKPRAAVTALPRDARFPNVSPSIRTRH